MAISDILSLLMGTGGQGQQPMPPISGPLPPSPLAGVVGGPQVASGQQFAQVIPIQISPQANGQYAVIDTRTGQTRHVGSLDSARQAQAQLLAAIRAGR